jgi:hypothetical protein
MKRKTMQGCSQAKPQAKPQTSLPKAISLLVGLSVYVLPLIILPL